MSQYVIKVFEAQWDQHHNETVKPFFEQLKRETPGHDALFSYVVFQNAEGLKYYLSRRDKGVGERKKIAYFACHGESNLISATQDISRQQLKNILTPLTSYQGLYFGACDFANRTTAEVLLREGKAKWVAGYDSGCPWTEGILCDLMFFRLLMSGRFVRPQTNGRWELIGSPAEAARQLYKVFPQAVDLHFSLFYRKGGRIRSTLEDLLDTKSVV